ncbi:MAG: hypothetical protein J7K11_04850 [Candidatus Hydrothermae bacterium]|nr:hypothetical protein [Candidatus Hydrothermae bacterium]
MSKKTKISVRTNFEEEGPLAHVMRDGQVLTFAMQKRKSNILDVTLNPTIKISSTSPLTTAIPGN